MKKKIAVILGHPSPEQDTFCHALAEAYVQGAREAGHEVTLIEIGKQDIPFLSRQKDYEIMGIPPGITSAQETLAMAGHWVLIYPLWLGTMPAKMKAFLEWALSPGFAYKYEKGTPKKMLAGKTARVIVTMGMPGFAYRFFFFAHSLKALERNILKFIGVKPVRHTLIGLVEAIKDSGRRNWLKKIEELGRQAG